MRAWHFVSEKLRDGRPVPADGEWLEHEGPLVMCQSGLHAGERPWDALLYASGPVLCLVELDGEIVRHDDKVVARRRKIISRKDITGLLGRFAREEALRVVDTWSYPEVVRRYLETGDESIRDAAYVAIDTAPAAPAVDAAYAATVGAIGSGSRASDARAAVFSAALAHSRARRVSFDNTLAVAGKRFDAMVEAEFGEGGA